MSERRQSEASARGLAHDSDCRERAQQPVNSIGQKPARRGDRSGFLGALRHGVGETEPCESSDGAGYPQAAQQLQHFLMQRRVDLGRFIAGAVCHPYSATICAKKYVFDCAKSECSVVRRREAHFTLRVSSGLMQSMAHRLSYTEYAV